jgi:hypothetical protein
MTVSRSSASEPRASPALGELDPAVVGVDVDLPAQARVGDHATGDAGYPTGVGGKITPVQVPTLQLFVNRSGPMH